MSQQLRTRKSNRPLFGRASELPRLDQSHHRPKTVSSNSSRPRPAIQTSNPTKSWPKVTTSSPLKGLDRSRCKNIISLTKVTEAGGTIHRQTNSLGNEIRKETRTSTSKSMKQPTRTTRNQNQVVDDGRKNLPLLKDYRGSSCVDRPSTAPIVTRRESDTPTQGFQRLHSEQSFTRLEKHQLMQDDKDRRRAEVYAVNKVLRDTFQTKFNMYMERRSKEEATK